MTTETELTAVDIEALERAFAIARAESAEEREHLDGIEAREGWVSAGESASYHLQCRNLKLKCWEAPPMHVHGDEIGQNYGTKPKEVKLKRRLLALGLSVYEPDPISAIERVESTRRNERVAVGDKKSTPVA
jgi:hypothetical protein